MKECSFQKEGEETHEKQQKMHMKKMKTKHSSQKKQRLDSLLSEKLLPDGNASLHGLDMRDYTVTQEEAIKEINAQITYFTELWRETK